MLIKLRTLLRSEPAGGLLLLAATGFALLVVNTPARVLYDMLLDTPVEFRVGRFEIAKPLLLWINDGLMSVFFFLIGLEIKREVLVGELSQRSRITLPAIGALGGMAAPAAIYAFLNWGDPAALQGWAIPSATDIAFALGILSLLGKRVPTSLKLFLMTLAIVDDLGAILVIALFYTSQLSVESLGVAGGALLLLFWLNRRGVVSIPSYVAGGLVLWATVLKSGVHATLAGALLALFIPLRCERQEGGCPLEQLEHDLHPVVTYFILPVFAFANTGIPLGDLSLVDLLAPVPLGIALGLFLGNQIGIMGFAALAVLLRLGSLPRGVTWVQLYGTSILCGVGFTMSLFISSLAFEQGGVEVTLLGADRLGILLGSAISGVVGYGVLRWTLPRDPEGPPATTDVGS